MVITTEGKEQGRAEPCSSAVPCSSAGAMRQTRWRAWGSGGGVNNESRVDLRYDRIDQGSHVPPATVLVAEAVACCRQ